MSLILALVWVWLLFVSVDRSSPRDHITLYVLDTSLSMGVEDILLSPTQHESRLDLAKAIILRDMLTHDGDMWLITYDRSPLLALPLTRERTLLRNIVSSITPREYYGGSDIYSALSLVTKLYGTSSSSLDIVILSDGGYSPEGVSALPDIPSLSTLRIIGIGTERWDRIPLGYNLEWERRYKIYQWKEIIVPYTGVFLEKIQEKYNATIERKITHDPHIKTSSLLEPYTPSSDVIRIIAIIILILATLLPLYVPKK